MTKISRGVTLFAVAALAATAFAPGRAAADMLSACSGDIGQFCGDVREGRGRIAACLVSQRDKLSGGCETEVAAVAERGGNSVLVPSAVRNLLRPGFSADVPPVCSPDIAELCPTVAQVEGRVFACLYARETQVSDACSAKAKEVLDGVN